MDIPGYRIEERIGEGGMSEVFRAEQLSLQRTVAVKFLSEQLLHHETATNLFENEPLIVARLNHPKIIHVIDKGITDSGKPYFIMEFVEGVTLHDLVQDEQLPVSRKVEYVIQICRGLSFAHRNGIIHRDIKPANIIIDKENNARILDFGIASFYTDERFVQKNASKVIGTERYMAPEVKRSSANATLLSDLYSLGVLMYEVFSENFIDNATKENIEKSNIPGPIKKVILQCTETDPAKRPTSASIVENRLLQIIKGAHLAVSQKASAAKDLASLSKKFTLLDVICENQFGSVYLYEKQGSSDLIVIKKRNHDASGLKEAKLLTTLKHKNIINIHGTSSNQRAFIVVMEYMDAGSLSDRLVKPFSVEEFFPIAHSLISGLWFAHQNRILHGNLRPSNILFSQADDVKLTDFGLSEHYHSSEDEENWYHPEKLEPLTTQLDIFALGAIFYHMLTGEPLSWKNGQIMWKESYSVLPKKLQEFLLKMLALAPEFRFDSCKEVLEQFEKLQRLPKKSLAKQNKFDAIGFKKKAQKTFSFLGLIRNVLWIIILAGAFTYLQIYFFFPEIKIIIHQTLRDFLLWWAEQLVEK